MTRDIQPQETSFRGIRYRSKTEAKWAVFFSVLGVDYRYEETAFKLETGDMYLPDFFIQEFNAYLEVKPDSDLIVTEECKKARQLAKELKPKGIEVLLAMGAPAETESNILPLSLWDTRMEIGEILKDHINRFQILEDRRDPRVYWLQSHEESDTPFHSFVIGGPGKETDHYRLPVMHWNVSKAYQAVKEFNP